MADWTKQRYFEEVKEGDEVPAITFYIPVMRMVMLAAGNRDFNPIHHNSEVARAQGAPDMYLNNVSVMSMWERAAQEFIGFDGRIKKVGPFRIRVFNPTGETVVTKGTVKSKRQEGGENLVELEMCCENSRGVSVGPGPVLVTLPSRGN